MLTKQGLGKIEIFQNWKVKSTRTFQNCLLGTLPKRQVHLRLCRHSKRLQTRMYPSLNTADMVNTLLLRVSKEERRKKRKGGCSATWLVKMGWSRATSCPFSNNNYWLIPFSSGEGGFQVRKSKSTFVIFFSHIPLKVNDVLFDRRIMKSQKTTGAMTPVLPWEKKCWCYTRKRNVGNSLRFYMEYRIFKGF